MELVSKWQNHFIEFMRINKELVEKLITIIAPTVEVKVEVEENNFKG